MGKLVFVLIVKKFEGFDEEGGFSKKRSRRVIEFSVEKTQFRVEKMVKNIGDKL